MLSSEGCDKNDELHRTELLMYSTYYVPAYKDSSVYVCFFFLNLLLNLVHLYPSNSFWVEESITFCHIQHTGSELF